MWAPSPVLTAPHPCQAGKQDTRQEEKGEKTHPQENDYIVFYKPKQTSVSAGQCWLDRPVRREQSGGQVGALLPGGESGAEALGRGDRPASVIRDE